MPTTSNFGWTTPADTDLVKDGALAIRTLGNGVDASLVDLKGGTTGQILSKASNTDLDYTWITNDVGDITEVTVSSPLTGGGASGSVNVAIQDGTTAQKGAVQLEDSTSSTSTTKAATPNSVKSAYDLAGGAIAKTLIDAEGDLIVGDAADAVQRLAIGSNGNVLTVDTSVDGKIKWAAPAGGGALTLITSTTISSATSKSVDNCFTSTYQNYKIFIATSAAASTALVSLRLRASSTDASTNYNYARLICNTNGVSAQIDALGTDEFFCGEASATGVSGLELTIYGPAETNETALHSIFAGRNPTNPIVQIFSGEHSTASAYDGFTLLSDQNLTGTIRVYGIANS